MSTLMIQGTGSDVGKSLLVAALGRACTRRGLRVRPFKPQNMANNAAVTGDGGEIGRAQALQARACGCATTTDLNPVLLKPEHETGAQLVVHGRVRGHAGARRYQAAKGELLETVTAAHARLAGDADIVLAEGAGSPAEINLRHGDIANMGFATAVGCAVALVADIHRGGVIASLVGTHALLTEDERALLAGYIVNNFRGDPALFADGVAAIGARTGLTSLGIWPHTPAANRLPAEDGMGIAGSAADEARPVVVAVPVFDRIANFDDLDPLRGDPGVAVRFIPRGTALPGDADLVVLPGSKATRGDLAVMRAEGWDIDVHAHRRRGGWVLGLCGGYQMLGTRIADPDGVEGEAGETEGLGLLAVETRLTPSKTLAHTRGRCAATGYSVAGYRMHMGATGGPDAARPVLRLDAGEDGATSSDGRVMGCYLHGLFANDGFRAAFLARLGGRTVETRDHEAAVEAALDTLADSVETHLHIDAMLEAADA